MTIKAALTSAFVAATVLTNSASADGTQLTAKSVVLVHGAFADGSAWSEVTPFLEQAGLEVISVQNPLDSLAGDVAFTDRAISRAKGPVVLVGHSWGGQVITEAGLNDKVQSLVYVAAYAPDAGQSLGEAAELDKFPAPGIAALQQDEAGYFFLPDDAMANLFAHDVPRGEAEIMAATQGLLNSKALGEPVSHAAWEHKPSFYVIAGEDYMTPTELQRQFAKKIGAIAREVDASHAVAVSQPKFVADMIIEAAK
ncbi:alpha/beta hydrolase [Tateyamaria omphalii]|uniref:alpha/beta fold hydrolase n=1 Tax=Tateyamaria omphalii TaxID=299262 RepID=UPI001675EECE|nr:alpha/beta hydrolase [Tateyamaria omphalii]GGX71123.1 alpha/beta hydrolase [Tateyamaria omphalii]